MIRTLFTVGCIAGFIACAFVPPTDANYQSLEQMAKTQVRTRTASSLVSGKSLNTKQAQDAAKILAAAAKNPAVQSAVKRATGTVADVKTLDEVVAAVQKAAHPTTVVKRVATVVTHAVKSHRFTSHWKNLKDQSSKEKRTQLERIEWASRKQDVRLCFQVQGDTIVTTGEYIALCVALVTGDVGRCEQVRGMKNACTTELATL